VFCGQGRPPRQQVSSCAGGGPLSREQMGESQPTVSSADPATLTVTMPHGNTERVRAT
jgi:hypothetical protein